MPNHVEIHLLRTFGPNCLNRGEFNEPKTAVFGGFERARISSQCLKSAIRKTFEDGWRSLQTRRMNDLLTKHLMAAKPEESQELIGEIAKQIASEISGGEGETVIKIGPDEIKKLTDNVVENWDVIKSSINKEDKKDKKKDKEFTNIIKKSLGTSTVDVALFGRMLANMPDGTVNAAMCVSHAVGVNRSITEIDYFTAVDDLDSNGAGHLSENNFNSACYYVTMHINLDLLSENLKDRELVKQALKKLLPSIITATPEGKQHGFLSRDPAQYVRVMISDRPETSLTAFEKPVSRYDDKDLSITEIAIERLRKFEDVKRERGLPRAVIFDCEAAPQIERLNGIPQLLEEFNKKIEELL